MNMSNKKLRLLPNIKVTRYANQHYLYDINASRKMVVSIPTQSISADIYEVIAKITRENPNREAWSMDQYAGLFGHPRADEILQFLKEKGYLRNEKTQSQIKQEESLIYPPEPGSKKNIVETYSWLIQTFDQEEKKRFFKQPVFFNLPTELKDEEVEVGIVGLPFSSIELSSGTSFAPNHLRTRSQLAYTWFDIFEEGFNSEIDIADELPKKICQNIILKDYGNLETNSNTISSLFNDLYSFYRNTLLKNKVRPIFIGGDHAVTFPIVDSLIKEHPNLHLIHLDAHNDLFYCEHILYDHAALVSNLLLYSNLEHVHSFGLRTFYDSRTKHLDRIANDKRLKGRLDLHSINSLKKFTLDPSSFNKHLQATIPKGTPCYLSIDLDVLTAEAIANQLSTPAGAGIEWWELFSTINILFDNLNIIGCDIVEFNLAHNTGGEDKNQNIIALILQLIDGLGKQAKSDKS